MIPRRRFEELVEAELEGRCTEEEFRELEQELKTSAERRRSFREAHLLHEMLQLEASGGSLARPRNVIPIDRVLQEQSRKEVRMALLAAVALIALVAVLLHVIQLQPTAAPLTVSAAPGSQYQITAANGTSQPVGALQPGAEVALREGTLLLEFGNGVRGIVQAPADFVFENPLKIRMSEGMGRFQVPYDARGFTVVGPTWQLVDLGTDFGVVERPEKDPQVHVFKGRVQVRATTGARQLRELVGGEALRLTLAGKWRRLALDSSLFYEQMPEDLPHVRLGFEPDASGELHATGNAAVVPGMRVMASANGPEFQASPWGMAAHFEGDATPVRTDWDGVEGAAPRTIAAWIRTPKDLPPRPFQSIVAWGDPTIGLAGKCELLLHQPQPEHGTVLRLSLDQYLFTGTTDLADGEWHHVAATFRAHPTDPQQVIVRLYVDGVEEMLDPKLSAQRPERIRGPRTRIRGKKSMPVMIGYTNRPGMHRGFRGEIDEVMIFEAALPPDRILRLRGKLPEESR